MAKGVDNRKNEKKEPTKTLKEKRLEKKAKKDKKQGLFVYPFQVFVKQGAGAI